MIYISLLLLSIYMLLSPSGGIYANIGSLLILSGLYIRLFFYRKSAAKQVVIESEAVPTKLPHDEAYYCPTCNAQIISLKYTYCTSCMMELPESICLDDKTRQDIVTMNGEIEERYQKARRENIAARQAQSEAMRRL